MNATPNDAVTQATSLRLPLRLWSSGSTLFWLVPALPALAGGLTYRLDPDAPPSVTSDSPVDDPLHDGRGQRSFRSDGGPA